MNQRDSVKRVITALTRVSDHRRQSTVWDAFMAISHATLRMLPVHAHAVTISGAMADDDAEAVEIWERLKKNGFTSEDFGAFAEAFAALCDAAVEVDGSVNYDDVLAEVYESWAGANQNTGQFFTPSSICKMMAMLSADGIMDLLRDRIVEAVGADKIAMIGFNPELPHTLRHIAENLLPPCIDRYRPITVCDPAVGSGSTLLAVAELLPDWANQWGLVHYYGQDIDHTAYLMATVNLMIRAAGYG
jgi:hypothetical protein